jgi:hypothetical protein
MTLRDRVALPLLLRSLIRIGRSIDQRLADQNGYLQRLADVVAPVVAADPVDPAARSVDFADDREQGRILDYIAQMQTDLGREPTEDEILQYLEGRPG